jgi:hypothetical protein
LRRSFEFRDRGSRDTRIRRICRSVRKRRQNREKRAEKRKRFSRKYLSIWKWIEIIVRIVVESALNYSPPKRAVRPIGRREGHHVTRDRFWGKKRVKKSAKETAFTEKNQNIAKKIHFLITFLLRNLIRTLRSNIFGAKSTKKSTSGLLLSEKRDENDKHFASKQREKSFRISAHFRSKSGFSRSTAATSSTSLSSSETNSYFTINYIFFKQTLIYIRFFLVFRFFAFHTISVFFRISSQKVFTKKSQKLVKILRNFSLLFPKLCFRKHFSHFLTTFSQFSSSGSSGKHFRNFCNTFRQNSEFLSTFRQKRISEEMKTKSVQKITQIFTQFAELLRRKAIHFRFRAFLPVFRFFALIIGAQSQNVTQSPPKPNGNPFGN